MQTKKKTSQIVIIIMCWLIYSLSYLGRYSYNSNITHIIDNYGVTKAQAGLVATCFFFAYGVGQIVNGIFSSRYNKKWLFPIVLLIASALNLAVFFGAPFFTFKYMWLVNGFVQSCLWSGTISIISKTVDDKHMKTALLFMSTTSCVGTVAAYSFSSLFSFLNNYRLSFLFGAVVMTALGVAWFLIYSPELEINGIAEKTEKDKVEGKSNKDFVTVLIILGFFAAMHNILKDGLTTWAPDILKSRYGISDSLSILLTVILPLLGVFGAFFSIWLNKYVKNFVMLASAHFAIGAAAMAFVTVFHSMNAMLAVIFFGTVVCMMHGINNVVVSLAPLKLRGSIDSGKMAGIMNGCAYVGSTISSYGLGKVADIGGWQMVLELLLAIIIPMVVIGVLYAILTSRKVLRNK